MNYLECKNGHDKAVTKFMSWLGKTKAYNKQSSTLNGDIHIVKFFEHFFETECKSNLLDNLYNPYQLTIEKNEFNQIIYNYESDFSERHENGYIVEFGYYGLSHGFWMIQIILEKIDE